jgi:hypothetical protein
VSVQYEHDRANRSSLAKEWPPAGAPVPDEGRGRRIRRRREPTGRRTADAARETAALQQLARLDAERQGRESRDSIYPTLRRSGSDDGSSSVYRTARSRHAVALRAGQPRSTLAGAFRSRSTEARSRSRSRDFETYWTRFVADRRAYMTPRDLDAQSQGDQDGEAGRPRGPSDDGWLRIRDRVCHGAACPARLVTTIFGGTSEIRRNIIAKTLGL